MGLAALVQAHILTLLTLLVAMVVIACKLRRHPRWQYVLLHVPVMGTLTRGQKLGQIFYRAVINPAGRNCLFTRTGECGGDR